MKAIVTAVAVAAVAALVSGQSAEEDLVTMLPGADGMGFTNQYAGYLDLPGTEKHVRVLAFTF
jgi:hypothetical protein